MTIEFKSVGPVVKVRVPSTSHLMHHAWDGMIEGPIVHLVRVRVRVGGRVRVRVRVRAKVRAKVRARGRVGVRVRVIHAAPKALRGHTHCHGR